VVQRAHQRPYVKANLPLKLHGSDRTCQSLRSIYYLSTSSYPTPLSSTSVRTNATARHLPHRLAHAHPCPALSYTPTATTSPTDPLVSTLLRTASTISSPSHKRLVMRWSTRAKRRTLTPPNSAMKRWRGTLGQVQSTSRVTRGVGQRERRSSVGGQGKGRRIYWRV